MKARIYSLAAYPFVRLVLLSILGICLAHFLDLSFLDDVFLLSCLAISLIIPALLKFFPRNGSYHLSFNIRIVCYHLFVILFAIYVVEASDTKPEQDEFNFLRSFEWEEVEIRGVVESYKYHKGGYRVFTINNHIQISGYPTIRCKCRILSSKIDPNLKEGDILFIRGKILPLSSARNPHEFDAQKWMDDSKIAIRVSVSSSEIIGKVEGYTWFYFRNKLKEKIDALYSPRTAPLATALIIGQKSDLSNDVRDEFSRVGLSHIMAVSGLHVGFLMAPFWLLISFSWKSFARRLILAFIMLIILYTYAGLTGFSPSVIRAAITGYILFAARLFYKTSKPINLTSCAAFIMLVVYPNSLFSVGFQLSFSAVYIILLVVPMVQRKLPVNMRFNWFSPLIMTAIVSFVIQIGLLPIQAYYFGEVSLISPLSNVLFVPLLGFILPAAIVILSMSFLSPSLSFILNKVANFYFELMMTYAEYVNELDFGWRELQLNNEFIWPLWIFGLLLIGHLHFRKFRFKLIILILITLFRAHLSSLISSLKPTTLEVTYFYVGQGDAALIQTPNQKSILIDTGVWSPSFNSSSLILHHLKKEGISKLDAVFLSHPHSDHIGGMKDLIGSVDIQSIYNSGFEHNSKLYSNYIRKASEYGIPVQSLKSGDIISIDTSIQIFIYSPNSELHTKNTNEHSLVMEIRYGDHEFLFTGDAEHQSEQLLIEHFPNLMNTDVLKVGHHGSRTSSDEKLVELMSPDIAIVSSGIQNKFNHPHVEAVYTMKKYSKQTFYTARDGAISVISDGKQLFVERMN